MVRGFPEKQLWPQTFPLPFACSCEESVSVLQVMRHYRGPHTFPQHPRGPSASCCREDDGSALISSGHLANARAWLSVGR